MSSVQAWTIRRVLQWTGKDFAARGLPSPRLDAELLLAHALDVDRVRLYLDLDRGLDDTELAAMRLLVDRRRRHEPVAYIVGQREFFGRRFLVSPAVLIPRPDTEILVERALARLPSEATGPVLDVGTGSGCIAISLACERPQLQVDALDISAVALEVAAANAGALGVAERVGLHCSDLLAALPREPRYALLVANLPYIVDAEVVQLMADVRDHEPHTALAGGVDGLALLRRLTAEASSYLMPEGGLLLEVGQGQAPKVVEMLQGANTYRDIAVHRDYGGIERVVEATLALVQA